MVAVGLVQPFRELEFAIVIEHLINFQGVELAFQAQRPLDGDVVEAEVVAVENFGGHLVAIGFLFHEVHVGSQDGRTMLRRDGAVARALVFPQFFKGLRSVDQLHLAFAAFGLLVGQKPHVGGDTRVVEDVVRQLDNGINQVLLNQIATDVALTAACVARKQRRPVVNGSHAAALWLEFERFHLVNLLQHKQQLSVGRARGTIHHLLFAGEIGQRQFKTVVKQRLLVVNLLLVCLPRFAVGRIGDHIAKRLVGKGVVGDGVAQVHPTWVNTFDNQVGLANGVGLRVDFRTRKLDGRASDPNIHKVFAAFRQHSTRTTSRVVQGDDLGEVVLHGLKNEVGQ